MAPCRAMQFAPSQIYRDPEGHPMVYVRTERRPSATVDEHLFIVVRDRMVYQRWFPAGSEAPPELELIRDVAGRRESELVCGEIARVERERDALVESMKEAVVLLPDKAAKNIRGAYAKRTQLTDPKYGHQLTVEEVLAS